MGGFAWVTLATNDSYSLGSLVLAHSLRRVGTKHRLVVLVTPGVTDAMKKKLSSVFDSITEVNILDSKDEANLRLLKRPELGITFTKLHCWRLTEYEKCVFLDADTMVLENSDELFEREELSAAPDVGWPDCFNSGVFVYRPSVDTYESLIRFALEKGSFDGGDQGLLNLYFADWAHKDISKHLPFIYNMSATATYSYLPAFKQYGGNVKIIHFIGNTKPWLQYFDTETRQVQPASGLNHIQDTLQHWWDIFCTLIYPELSEDMARSSSLAVHYPLIPQHNPIQNTEVIQTYTTDFDYKNVYDPWDEYDQKHCFDNEPNIDHSLHIVTVSNQNIESHNTNAHYIGPVSSPQTVEPSHPDGPVSSPQTVEPSHPNNNNLPPHVKNNFIVHSQVNNPSPPVINANPPQSQHKLPNNSTSVYHPPQDHHLVYNLSSENRPASSPPCINNSSSQNKSENNQTSIQTQSTITNAANEFNTNAKNAFQPNAVPILPLIQESALPHVYEPDSTVAKENALHNNSNDVQSTEDAGFAGAFAKLTLGAPRSSGQIALEDHLRRQGWEVGNIDYMGRDSFDNIWRKICETLSTAPVREASPPKSAATEESTASQLPPETSVLAPSEQEPIPVEQPSDSAITSITKESPTQEVETSIKAADTAISSSLVGIPKTESEVPLKAEETADPSLALDVPVAVTEVSIQPEDVTGVCKLPEVTPSVIENQTDDSKSSAKTEDSNVPQQKEGELVTEEVAAPVTPSSIESQASEKIETSLQEEVKPVEVAPSQLSSETPVSEIEAQIVQDTVTPVEIAPPAEITTETSLVDTVPTLQASTEVKTEIPVDEAEIKSLATTETKITEDSTLTPPVEPAVPQEESVVPPTDSVALPIDCTPSPTEPAVSQEESIISPAIDSTPSPTEPAVSSPEPKSSKISAQTAEIPAETVEKRAETESGVSTPTEGEPTEPVGLTQETIPSAELVQEPVTEAVVVAPAESVEIKQKFVPESVVAAPIESIETKLEVPSEPPKEELKSETTVTSSELAPSIEPEIVQEKIAEEPVEPQLPTEATSTTETSVSTTNVSAEVCEIKPLEKAPLPAEKAIETKTSVEVTETEPALVSTKSCTDVVETKPLMESPSAAKPKEIKEPVESTKTEKKSIKLSEGVPKTETIEQPAKCKPKKAKAPNKAPEFEKEAVESVATKPAETVTKPKTKTTKVKSPPVTPTETPPTKPSETCPAEIVLPTTETKPKPKPVVDASKTPEPGPTAETKSKAKTTKVKSAPAIPTETTAKPDGGIVGTDSAAVKPTETASPAETPKKKVVKKVTKVTTGTAAEPKVTKADEVGKDAKPKTGAPKTPQVTEATPPTSPPIGAQSKTVSIKPALSVKTDVPETPPPEGSQSAPEQSPPSKVGGGTKKVVKPKK